VSERDRNELVDAHAVADMLRAYEGPPHPRPRRRPSYRATRAGRGALAVGGLAAVVLAIVAVGALVDGGSAPSSQVAGRPGCESTLEFRGATYYGRDFAPAGPREPVGRAVEPPCIDEPGAEPDEAAPRPVGVARVAGIDPAVAVVADGRDELFVLGGRCVGFGQGEPFLSCLEQPLVFEGVRYTAARLEEPPARGEARGEGTHAGGRVAVVGLDGIEPSRALTHARADPGVIYVAAGICPVQPGVISFEAELIECLRAPG
jgi:Family of unknown function (DUF6281)